MPRSERAKQFMPFDTLKGLKNALRMKEYEHERVSKGELSEEKATEISKKLLNLNKKMMQKWHHFYLYICFYCGGFYFFINYF